MTPARLDAILAQTAGKRLLVIGDLMLDEFVWGKVGRISPEAPVPVVEVTRESFYPGGAANTARNLREFIDHVSVIGLLGQDSHGEQLRKLLAVQQIDTSHAVEDSEFRTIVKTRIIARQQQVVRIDRELVGPLASRHVASVSAAVRQMLPEIDAIIFEDYGKGFLGSELVGQITRDAQQAGKIVAADPNPNSAIDWTGTTVVKPNRTEAFVHAGISPSDSDKPPMEDEDLHRVGQILLEKWKTQLVLITLGEHGMMLFQHDQPPHHIPTKARQVFDVSGAGDTAMALFTLALCGGATPREAADIANHASAVVVGKLGTATVTPGELLASFRDDSKRG
jgi:D-beta-D-heptose 7-phosphate kinase/D-beta-D-heptose 1-phosphate adenosyltransferase